VCKGAAWGKFKRMDYEKISRYHAATQKGLYNNKKISELF
jgi:hypothetical protein